jgi:aminocarboxymuconate-semialdehyde decarboxylase
MEERATAMAGLDVIDVHAHILPSGLPDFHQLTGDPRWPRLLTGSDDGQIMCGESLFRRVRPALWDLATRVAELDTAGVGLQVVSPVPVTLTYWAEPSLASGYCRALNDAIAADVARAEGRLRGLGAVPLQDVDAAIAELGHIMNDLGLDGAEIGTVVNGRELDDPALRPFFAAAEQFGAVLAVHPMDGGTGVIRREGQPYDFGIGMLTDTAMAAAALVFGGVVDDYPGLRIVLAHGCGSYPWVYPRLRMGSQILGGFAAERLDELTRALWVDALVFDPAHLGLLAHRFGVDHIVVGTDHPFVPGQLTAVPELVRTAAATVVIAHSDVAAILSGNAANLLSRPRR